MTGFDLLEALTEVDDEQILQAEEPSAVRKPRRLWHGLVAACLVLAILTTTFVGISAVTQDTTMRYTIRYRENRVTYLCKVSSYRFGPVPLYQPEWLPEGYVYDRESSMGENERMVTYRNTAPQPAYLSFSYVRVTGVYKTNFYTLSMGSYERQPVAVNGLPGQLYLYAAPRTGGELIWVDEGNSLLLRISFQEATPADVLTMANSVTRTD